MLSVRLFGALAASVDGTPLPPMPGMRARSLLAYLLLRPGPHPRGRVAGVFWPDVLDTSARASLRSTVWTIRQALQAVGGERYLVADRGTVGIDPGLPRDVDLETFRDLTRRGGPGDLERAAALAAEPLVADIPDEWALAAQDEVREELLGVLERLANRCEQAGDRDGAVAWTRRALTCDRLREHTHRALIRRLDAAGERAEALAAYRRCREVLAAELGVLPAPATRALVERLRAGEAGPADPPVVPAPAPPPEVRPPLAGRDPEILALREARRAAAGGGGGLAVVRGAAGIGKTRLVRAVLDEAVADGALTALGAPLEVTGGPPLTAWAEALRALIPAVPAPPAGAGWPADLARLCPDAAEAWGLPQPGPPGPPELERIRLFEAAASLLARASRDRPVVLVLEDLHRADDATLALLSFVGRRLPEWRVLLVVTAREQAPDAEAVVAALAGRGVPVTVRMLGPLGDEAVADLVRTAAPGLDEEEARRAAAAGDGNPLLTLLAARAAAAGEDPADGVRDLVRGTVTRLPEPALLLAELTAVAGRPLAPAEMLDLVGPDDLRGAVADGVACGLLEPAGRGVGFRHDILRRAFAAEIPASRTCWLHERLARAVAQRPVPGTAAEVARHLRGADRPEAARPHLLAAAREARALGALVEADAFLLQALDDPGLPPAEAAEIWLSRAEIAAWRERRESMDAAYREALGILTASGDVMGQAAAHVARGHQLRTGLCYPRESLEAYHRALGLLRETGHEAPELRVLALAGVAWGEAMAGDPRRVDALLAEIEAMPEAGGDPVLAVELDLARIAALIRSGRLDEVDAPGTRALRRATEAGRPDLVGVVAVNVAAAAGCRGDVGRVLELADATLAGAVAGPTLTGYMHTARAYALSAMGRHEEALAAVADAAALHARHAQTSLAAADLFDEGCLLMAAGRYPDAAERLAGSLSGHGRHVSPRQVHLLRAEALAAAGDHAAAEAALEEFPFAPAAPTDVPEVLLARLRRVEGLVAERAGDHATAAARLREAAEDWRRLAGALSAGDMFAATVTDLGRPPLAGLVEPEREMARTLEDLARVTGAAAAAPPPAGAPA